VQVGKYCALPHGSATPQVVREGSILLIDGGCKVEGYSSDISRTFVLGKATQRMKDVFEIEHRAQSAALADALVRQGADVVEVAVLAVVAPPDGGDARLGALFQRRRRGGRDPPRRDGDCRRRRGP